MYDDIQKQIFAQNLTYYLNLHNKSQKEVADAINVSPQTFNTWCQGIALPRMGKVQLLADFFHISKSDLLDEHSNVVKKAPGIRYVGENGTEKLFDYSSIVFSIIEAVSKMPPEQQEMVNNMVGGKTHITKNHLHTPTQHMREQT